jgi:hypothetical protein
VFYVFYRDLRLNLLYRLRTNNPPLNAEPKEVHEVRLLDLAQKFPDRCLFICFCEDPGLLMANVLTKALTAKAEGFVQVSRWQLLCGLFAAVDKGHPPMWSWATPLSYGRSCWDPSSPTSPTAMPATTESPTSTSTSKSASTVVRSLPTCAQLWNSPRSSLSSVIEKPR